jgi:hypothetical protein
MEPAGIEPATSCLQSAFRALLESDDLEDFWL